MIKKLLKNFINIFSYDYDREKIEKYLSNSTDAYDLESRQKELDKNGSYNKFYI